MRITDNCDITADAGWQAPPLPVVNITRDNSRLCQDSVIVLIATMSPILGEPISYQWQIDGVDIIDAADEFLVVSPTDVGSGATFSVMSIDFCGNEAMAEINLTPEDFIIPESSISVSNEGLTIQPGCPVQLTTMFTDGITGSNTADNYTWNTGEMTPNIFVDEPGIYTVIATDLCGREVEAGIEITEADLATPSPLAQIDNIGFNPCDFELQGMGVPGEEGGLVFSIDASEWTGPGGFNSETDLIIVPEIGTYTYEVTDICGNTASAFFDVTSLDIPDPTVEITNGGLTNVCTINLQAQGTSITGNHTFSWSTNQGGPQIIAVEPGTFSVTITDECGQTSENTITLVEADFINPDDPTVTISAQDDPNLDCGMILTAIVNGNPIEGFMWSTGETSASITVEESGTYTVTVTANCGKIAESEELNLSLSDLRFPNIFFPGTTNHEEINSTFGPETDCPNFSDYRLEIFNRWGKRVFETDNLAVRWSGSQDNSGQRLEEDVYMWQCFYTESGVEQSQKGSITMVRAQ